MVEGNSSRRRQRLKKALGITVLFFALSLLAGCGGSGGGSTNPQSNGPVSVTGKISPYGFVGDGILSNGIVSIYQSGHVGDSDFRVATADVDGDAAFQLSVAEGGIYDLRVDYESIIHALGQVYRIPEHTDELGIKLTPPATDLGTIEL